MYIKLSTDIILDTVCYLKYINTVNTFRNMCYSHIDMTDFIMTAFIIFWLKISVIDGNRPGKLLLL